MNCRSYSVFSIRNYTEIIQMLSIFCSGTILFLGSPFPKNYISVVKTILKRLFRVFVHVYIHHFDKLVAIGAVSVYHDFLSHVSLLCPCMGLLALGLLSWTMCDVNAERESSFKSCNILDKCSQISMSSPLSSLLSFIISSQTHTSLTLSSV